MKPKTVNEVLLELKKLQSRGYGDHILLVSDDEECNGYHALFGWCSGIGNEGYCFMDDKTGKPETLPTVMID